MSVMLVALLLVAVGCTGYYCGYVDGKNSERIAR